MNFTFCFRKYRLCEKYEYKEVKITQRPGKAIACECSRKKHLAIALKVNFVKTTLRNSCPHRLISCSLSVLLLHQKDRIVFEN